MDQKNSCSHPSVLKLICTSCGKRLQHNYGLPFGYITKGLRLSRHEADKLRHLQTNNFLSKNKLILVLDLDQTLINSSQISALSPDEKYLAHTITTSAGSNIVKLRPFVLEFLQEASSMFEMYVYTLATKIYAERVIKLLDPENKYLGSRLITREDSLSSDRKNLDVVLGRERATIILDDRKDVWPMHNANLIQVNGYNYFSSTIEFGSKVKSLAEQKCDENGDIMVSYLNLLKQIHSRFFDDPKGECRDVRDVIRRVRHEILKGDKILFRQFSAEKRKQFEHMAKKMGAICANELDSSVTHVVAKNAADKENLWAACHLNKCHLVDPRWIRDCYKLWHRVPEKYYMLDKKK